MVSFYERTEMTMTLSLFFFALDILAPFIFIFVILLTWTYMLNGCSLIWSFILPFCGFTGLNWTIWNFDGWFYNEVLFTTTESDQLQKFLFSIQNKIVLDGDGIMWFGSSNFAEIIYCTIYISAIPQMLHSMCQPMCLASKIHTHQIVCTQKSSDPHFDADSFLIHMTAKKKEKTGVPFFCMSM